MYPWKTLLVVYDDLTWTISKTWSLALYEH